MRIEQRQRLLAFATIAIVALFALDRLLPTPLTNGWKSRAGQLEVLRKSVEQGRNVIKREAHTRRIWNDIRKTTLPVNASQAEKELLGAFERWSAETRISVSSIRPQWKKGASDDYSVLECRVDASGSLLTIAKFLYQIESSPMAVKMENVEITSRDNNGQQIAVGILVSAVRLASVDVK